MNEIICIEQVGSNEYVLVKDGVKMIHARRFDPSEIDNIRSKSFLLADYMTSANSLFDRFVEAKNCVDNMLDAITSKGECGCGK